MNIWVTGASKGIGKAIALELLRENHKVAVSSRDKTSLREVYKSVNGNLLLQMPVDVRSYEQVTNTANLIIEKFGSIDVLINNAGVTKFKPVSETTIEEFDEIIDVNLKGVVNGIKAVLPYMMERQKGWIVNIISVTVNKVFTNSGAYASSKAGVLALTNVLREEVRDKGIKVTSIIPGATGTEMWPAGVLEKYEKRMMQAENVAKVVASVLRFPDSIMIEEVLVRPQLGDL
jgi:NADP-dependent 3-hydroxy acid dehydrogenase YdfG